MTILERTVLDVSPLSAAFCTPAAFHDTMEAHGISCEKVSQDDFVECGYHKATSSFTTTHHDAARGKYYYTPGLTQNDWTHELGHLFTWDLLGRPPFNNFGIDGNEPAYARQCKKLFEGLIGPVPNVLLPGLDWSELLTCCIEAAIIRRNRKSNRSVYTQLRGQNWIGYSTSREEDRAILTGMLIAGEVLLNAHAELWQRRSE